MFHEPLEFSNTAYFEGCATRWAFTDQLVAGGDHLVDTPRLQAASANICKHIKDHKGTFRTLLPKYLGKMPVYVSISRPNIPQYFWNAKTMDHSTIGRWHCGPLNLNQGWKHVKTLSSLSSDPYFGKRPGSTRRKMMELVDHGSSYGTARYGDIAHINHRQWVDFHDFPDFPTIKKELAMIESYPLGKLSIPQSSYHMSDVLWIMLYSLFIIHILLIFYLYTLL